MPLATRNVPVEAGAGHAGFIERCISEHQRTRLIQKEDRELLPAGYLPVILVCMLDVGVVVVGRG